MAEERVQRRLSAIMATDVVGYSRLMGDDETGTLAALKQLRAELIDPTIADYHGRIVKLMGDGALVEFASAIDAVECAISIQREVSRHNTGLPENKSIAFRIGINVGDVIIDGDDIYGDGVNIAARLEGIADPGGICISGMVFDYVKGKLDTGFEDLGTQEVKNIAEPVRAYRVTPASIVYETVSDLPLPEKPSIAVLPFDNMSDSHEQEYFSDGIAEDLTTALSRFDWLFVVARNSAFTYKGGAIDVKRVGRELGVRYVLEGSVRRAGNRVRVTVQLIDTQSDHHVWAEQFDREMEDVFELQDDIVARIAATVGPEITQAEIERAQGKRPETFDAWDHYLQATAACHRMTKDDLEAAIGHLKKAIKIEPDFANAYALLALCHASIGMFGWTQPVRTAFEAAQHCAEEAVRLTPSSPEANQALAFVLSATGQAERAIMVARRATELNPNFAEAHVTLGHALVLCGDLEGSLAACRRAERSNPRDTRGSWLLNTLGHAYFFLGEYDKAIEVSEKALLQERSFIGSYVTLACTYAQLGREIDAKRYIDELLEYIPRYSLRALRKNPMFVDPELVNKLVKSMELAGLPE
jgi:TolB-like protein/class 3 adenylate cyclase/Tfp pilus assembly protein PilF